MTRGGRLTKGAVAVLIDSLKPLPAKVLFCKRDKTFPSSFESSGGSLGRVVNRGICSPTICGAEIWVAGTVGGARLANFDAGAPAASSLTLMSVGRQKKPPVEMVGGGGTTAGPWSPFKTCWVAMAQSFWEWRVCVNTVKVLWAVISIAVEVREDQVSTTDCGPFIMLFPQPLARSQSHRHA